MSPPILAVIQMLLSAQGLEDVRATTAHAAQLISRYSTLSLYELQDGEGIALTYRSGDELAPGPQAVEDLLCSRALQRSRSVSTLDIFVDQQERLAVADYIRYDRLCLVRPLAAYGELVGLVSLHYNGRIALDEAEFDGLRRFAEYASVALSIARARTELRSFAYSDALTGLANRRWLEAEFTRLQGTEISVLLIDFDGLKAVNDTLGFDRGDALIHAVGLALAASAAPGESVVRYGGDEFVVVMPASDRIAAVRRAEEVTAILDHIPLAADLAPLFRGASVGAATASAGEDLWDVLRRANREMLSRKRRRKTDRASFGPEYHSSRAPGPEARAADFPRSRSEEY
jgi:diguanylate cyclase (GGDEF)-like protein